MDQFVSICLVLAFTSTCHLVESSSINQFEGSRELPRRSDFEAMEGNGWCVDDNGGEGTARKFIGDTSYKSTEDTCNADDKCVAFAYAADTGIAVLYTTTGCTEGCSNTAWAENPSLITGAYWCCGQTWWEKAICYRR